MAMVRGKDVMASVMNIRMMTVMTVTKRMMAMIRMKSARMIMLRLSNR